MLYDPYAYLEFWPRFCSEAMLPFVPNSLLFVIDHSPYYELIPLHSTDDGHTGYPGDVSFFYSDSSFSSDSLPAGAEARERCIFLIVRWLAPPCHPRTSNIKVQIDHDVVPEKQQEGTGTKHIKAHWRCYQGHPYCLFGAFSYFSCMAQEGGESNWMDMSADGLGKMTITTPSCDPLDKYLHEKKCRLKCCGSVAFFIHWRSLSHRAYL